MKFIIELVCRRIAGDIAMADDTGAALRKWREIFGASQSEVAKVMGVSPSVVSDYEKNRRSPGVKFIRKFVEALIKIDERRGWQTVKKVAGGMLAFAHSIIDMKEFVEPIDIDKLISLVEGIPLSSIIENRRIYGYTVLDSIAAITSMSGHDFWYLMGITTERVLIFTNVERGRSPMIAVRVAPVKPAAVVIHGPRKTVDFLAITLSDLDRVPLILSTLPSVDDIVLRLRSVSMTTSTTHLLTG